MAAAKKKDKEEKKEEEKQWLGKPEKNKVNYHAKFVII